MSQRDQGTLSALKEGPQRTWGTVRARAARRPDPGLATALTRLGESPTGTRPLFGPRCGGIRTLPASVCLWQAPTYMILK